MNTPWLHEVTQYSAATGLSEDYHAVGRPADVWVRTGHRVDDAELRRREFIRAHHPDRGGDPDVFVSGLRSIDAEQERDSQPLPPVVVVPHRAWLVRLVSAVITRLRPESNPPRVR